MKLLCVSVCNWCLLFTASLFADQTLDPQLEQVLQKEASGQLVDRRLETSADGVTSQWHRGIVVIEDGQWDFEQLVPTEGETEYLSERSESPIDDQRHLALAKWCARHGLPQQSQAHLQAALQDKPNDLTIRQALGHTWIAGRWFTSDELEQARLDADKTAQAISQWMPRLERLVSRLSATSAKVKSKALAELNAIQDVDAIAAMEILVDNSGRDVAGLLVNHIASFPERKACLALTRLAVNSDQPNVSEQAIGLLKRYPREHYVPELLGLLAETSESQSRLVSLPNGDLALHYLVIREMQDRKEIHQYTKYVTPSVKSNVSVEGTGSQNVAEMNRLQVVVRPAIGTPVPTPRYRQVSADIWADGVAMQKSLAAQKEMLESQHASIRQHLARRNARVMTVLAQTQMVTPGKTAEAWWNWWTQENERYVHNKPTYNYRKYDSQRNPSLSIAALDVSFLALSCLVAGTPIQTSRGLVPIEKIQVGDLVMSQDVETGELTLKPVFQTTVRPPKITLSIKTSAETVQATPGHCWWVSGRGWLRAKELKAGMMLHTARGNTEIESVEADSNEVETYNLVVADFHTYFVGEQRILSYDNTPVKPSFRAVPGYGTVSLKR